MVKVLKEKECRLTPQRLAILRILSKSVGHPRAEQIFEPIRADYPTTSLGSHYDGNKPYPHPHLMCTDCGQILDPEFGPMAGISLEIARQTGYKIT